MENYAQDDIKKKIMEDYFNENQWIQSVNNVFDEKKQSTNS